MYKMLFIVNLLVFFLPVKAHSFSSSSYLIANSALMLYDYNKAKNYYDNKNLHHLNEVDLEKRLLVYVNTHLLENANEVAKKILSYDSKNEEAWLVYLIHAKLNNLKEPFIKYSQEIEFSKLEVVDYVFFENNLLKTENNEISRSVFDIFQTSISDKINNTDSFDYFIFYLSLTLFLNENFNEAYYFLGEIYQKLNKYQKAEIYFSKVVNSHVLYLESQKNIAINKIYTDDKEKAEKDILFLIEQNKDNSDLLIALANLYRQSSQYSKALKVYSKILNDFEIDKSDLWRFYFLRGICYERINNWNLAESDFKESLNLEPDNPQVLNYLAYGWLERNLNIDKALNMLEIAHSKFPESHYILDSLAWAHFKKNNLNLASKLMEEVIFRAPNEAISLDHLGDIYFALGRKREAFFMWKQAKDLAQPEDKILDSVNQKLNTYNEK